MSVFYSFDTARSVTVKSKPIGLLYWTVFLGILAYIMAFSLYMQRGYQATVPVRGLVDMKVKGICWPGSLGGAPPTGLFNGTAATPIFDQEDVAQVLNNK